MNDATRELGAALGIAVLGSVAATKYTSRINHVTLGLAPAIRSQSRVSLADALAAAAKLHGASGRALAVGSQHAFLDGIHLAVLSGAALAAVAAVTVLRFLPRQVSHQGAPTDPIEALENVAELGVAGVPPVAAGDADGSGPPQPGPVPTMRGT
jgi:hypothetical protein